MEDIEKWRELFENTQKQMVSIISFGQTIIETYREKAEKNFLFRFPMLFFHEVLQSGRGFLLLTKKDSIDYPSGAVVLLKNGFESIVWGTSCLDDGEGTDLIDYIWNHQDMIMERDMAIYKNGGFHSLTKTFLF